MNNEKKHEQIQGLTPVQQRAFDVIFAHPAYRLEAEILKTGIEKLSRMLYDIETDAIKIMDVYKKGRE